jgi:hypothetical protein
MPILENAQMVVMTALMSLEASKEYELGVDVGS